jgi:hypothetical protein
MATPTPVGTQTGFPAHYGSHIRNVWASAQGDNMYVTPTAGNTLVTVVFGAKSPVPFDLLHTGNSNAAYLPDLLSFNQPPTVTDTSAAAVATITNSVLAANVVTLTAANNFQVGDTVKFAGLTNLSVINGLSLVVASSSTTQFTVPFTHANIGTAADAGTATKTSGGNDWFSVTPSIGSAILSDSDYTPGSYPPSPWPAVNWGLDGNFPSIYIYYALDVVGGSYNVNVSSCYQNGTTRPSQLAAGKPIFDGGIDAVVLEFSGILPANAQDGSTAAVTAAINGAGASVVPSFTTTTAGDMILTVGYMKNGNAFSQYAPAGTTGTTILTRSSIPTSQGHGAVQFQLQTGAGAITPGFLNPLQYEMSIIALALKHS